MASQSRCKGESGNASIASVQQGSYRPLHRDFDWLPERFLGPEHTPARSVQAEASSLSSSRFRWKADSPASDCATRARADIRTRLLHRLGHGNRPGFRDVHKSLIILCHSTDWSGWLVMQNCPCSKQEELWSGFELSGAAPTAYSTYAGNHTAEKDAPVARTALGVLRGVWIDGVAAFLGVPYALPPVGPLRFAPASPAHSWGAANLMPLSTARSRPNRRRVSALS